MQQIEWASEAQREFFTAPPGGPILFASGYGGGKTWAACLKALWIADTFANSRIAIVRRTSAQIRKTVLQSLMAMLPVDRCKRYSEQTGVIELQNGSTIYLIHLDTPDSLGMLRSLELNAAIVEQAEELSEDAFNLLVTRVGRWSHAVVPDHMLDAHWEWRDQAGNPMVPTWTLLTCNSPGYDHWLYNRFAEESPDRAHWDAQGYRVLYTSSRDNRFLSQATLDALTANDQEFIDRFVDFSWGSLEGSIHTISNLSLLEPTQELLDQIKTTMRLHRSLDYGSTSPTACTWWATDGEGNIFAYREYYEPNLLISEHRKNITALSEGERYVTNLADPSIFHRTAQKHGGRWSVSDEFFDSRFLPADTALSFTPADNNELGTRNRISEYLRVDPDHAHPITKEKGAPHLYFIRKRPSYPDGIDMLLKETRAQKKVKVKGTEEALFTDERDDKVSDHAYDTLRYFIASRPSPTRESYDPRKDINTFVGYSLYSQKMRKERARGGKTDYDRRNSSY